MIDAYTHFAPPGLMGLLERHSGVTHPFRELFERVPALSDLGRRFELMDRYGVEQSVLIPLPWIDSVPVAPNLARDVARSANEAMAEIESRSAGRCRSVALVVCDGSDDLDAQLDHAFDQLGLCGTVLFCGPQSLAVDHPSLEVLYGRSAAAAKPIWLHPCRPPSFADYRDYDGSRHQIWSSLGWVYDTSVAMVHLAMSGVFRRFPSLVIIGHHLGGMLPFFHDRFAVQFANFGDSDPDDLIGDTRLCYCDTATFGENPSAVRAAVDFFGVGRVLFGTDSPMDVAHPGFFVESALRSIDKLDLSAEQRRQIRSGNARRILSGAGEKAR